MSAHEVDVALDAAVDNLNLFYAADTGFPPGVVVDYLLIYATRRYDEDGDAVTAYGTCWPSDQRTSHYAGLGLLEYAKAKITRQLFDQGSTE